MQDKVIPGVDHPPKRVYTRVGSTITCREVTGIESEVDLTVTEGLVLFTLRLPLGSAKMLMEDLYYGQYTGG